jgi:hypothetical protein
MFPRPRIEDRVRSQNDSGGTVEEDRLFRWFVRHLE